jgi:predicted DsbA family dithiol-disulfide isomerase
MLSDLASRLARSRIATKPARRLAVSKQTMTMKPVRDLRHRFRRRASSDELERELARLVIRRQSLRSCGASDAALERNRRKIVRLQHELAHALIARHRVATERTAA